MQRRFFIASIATALLAENLMAKPYFLREEAAANGYDVVAYFSENKPVKGDPKHRAEWDDAVWYFSSAENLALFEADPAAYAPQYGGWCAFAMSKDAQATTVPEAFTVVDGKLYLNYSLDVREIWSPNKEKNIELADGFWPNYRQ